MCFTPSCLGATFETTPTLYDSLTSANRTLSGSGSDDEEMREIARKINALSLGSEDEGSDGDADDEGREEEEDEGETAEEEEDDDSATEKGVTWDGNGFSKSTGITFHSKMASGPVGHLF